MPRLVQPDNSIRDLPLFFNVDAPVGNPPAANRELDVLLLQFFMELMAKYPLSYATAEERSATKAVRKTGQCDAATVSAIVAIQKRQVGIQAGRGNYGKIVDGRVSPARGYRYGRFQFTIITINESVQNKHREVWPRIDKIPGFPQKLKPMMIEQVIGTVRP